MISWPKDLLKPLRRVTTAGKHIPAFDGLRCLAILWIVVYHLHGSFWVKAPLGERAPDEGILHTLLIHGRQGVPLFFALSGFFLCLPFARQYVRREGTIDLKAYYIRRFIRIVPPYWIAVLTIAVIYTVMGRYNTGYLVRHTVASLGFVHTVALDESNILNFSFWALEILIHFYLIAPLMVFLYFLMGRIARRTLALLVIVLLPFFQKAYELTIAFTLIDFIQYFIAGFVIADIYVSRKGSRSGYELVPIVALPVILFTTYDDSIIERIVYPLMIIGLYLAVLLSAFWERVFNKKGIVAIGGISYSIFLIHLPIIGFVGTFTMPIPMTGYYYLDFLIQCAIIGPVILILSLIFYLAAERPFMLIRPHGPVRSVDDVGAGPGNVGTGSDIMNAIK
ncbi:MAG TPA: acyltransferase [Cyclobacteriaceae bacterium]|nr:acyltransferase [Cyclobacteriaceae bacterium]